MIDTSRDGWRKSSRSSANGACVELKMLDAHTVGVRDSKQGESGDVLRFTPTEFAAFKRSIVDGESAKK